MHTPPWLAAVAEFQARHRLSDNAIDTLLDAPRSGLWKKAKRRAARGGGLSVGTLKKIAQLLKTDINRLIGE
jgi:hypothetical protein